jgi:DNA repair exonuclease SbcCD ATPase subunit
MPQQNEDLFSSLVDDTNSNIDTMSKGPVDVASQLADIESEREELANIADETERLRREEILNAKLDTIRQSIQSDEKDMAKAVYGMKVLIDSMDKEFQALVENSAEEKKILSDAAAHLEESKKNLQEAEEKKGFLGLGWGKEGKIKEATAALQEAQIYQAQAQKQVEEMKRERLMSADIEQTLNIIQVMGQKTIDIMSERTSSIRGQLEAIQARKAKAFQTKNEASTKTSELLGEVETLENELQNEELAVDSFEIGTAEHSTQLEKVSKLRSSLQDLRGKLKIAQAVLDEKTKSIQEHEAHEEAQQKLLSNHQMWIATLKSKLQEDLVKDQSYLEMLKAAADQEIAQNVDTMTDEKNARQMENVAKIIVASDKAYIEKMQLTPDQIRRRANVASALAKHAANLSDDESALREEMIKNYGIDPLSASEFTYKGEEAEAPMV